mgnify:CR=1 FL=1
MHYSCNCNFYYSFSFSKYILDKNNSLKLHFDIIKHYLSFSLIIFGYIIILFKLIWGII